MGKVMQANLAALDPDAQAQSLLEEIPALVADLSAKPGVAKGSKDAAKEGVGCQRSRREPGALTERTMPWSRRNLSP